MLVPCSVPHGPPLPLGRDGRGCRTPGAVTSGFSSSESGVGPAGREARDPVRVRRRGHGDRAGAFAGEPTEPKPKSPKSFPAATTGTTPGRGGALERADDEVAGRLDLRLAEREVDHVHPVRDRRLDRRCDLGRVPVETEARRRDRQRLVVAEVARSARRPRACAPRRRCRRPPLRFRPTCVAWNEFVRVERRVAYFHFGAGGANVRWTITFGVAHRSGPSGSRAGTRSPAG